jgi:uncharacterized RmlC-like cupin family protein
MKHCIVIACVLLTTSVQSSYVASAFRRTAASHVVSGSSRTVTVAQTAEMTRVPQFDNGRATSWTTVIPPHTESTLHRHDRYRTVIGIVGGDLTTVSADGHKTVTRYETGKAYWQPPMPPGEMHKDANDSDKTIELVVVELK